ncbi:classical arabinogalactan protein 11-like [Eucalyptus grandis]|uniref:classical arabinogalactan protein 11-like n=1 Tax=Eucalyptus grandis TaxID=71139 RepID=UPI00192E804C|nr:classical arabinogalactan protein 11-like [Eucalyptus grandis]
MARQLVVLALVLVAILGLASAQAPAKAPAAHSGGEAAAPADDSTVGPIDDAPAGGDDAIEAPVGGPVPEGAFPPTQEGPAQAPSSENGATVTKVSAVAVVAAVAGYFF